MSGYVRPALYRVVSSNGLGQGMPKTGMPRLTGGFVDGCKCPSCWGLAEYMSQLTGKTYGLAPAPGHAPVVALEERCDGSYTCPCRECDRERRERVARLQKVA